MLKKELQTIKKAIQKKELKYYILGRLLRIIILMLFTGLISWMFYEYLQVGKMPIPKRHLQYYP